MPCEHPRCWEPLQNHWETFPAAHPCCSGMAPELWEMLEVLPTASPAAGMGMHRAASLPGCQGIPGGTGPPSLHPQGSVPSHDEWGSL